MGLITNSNEATVNAANSALQAARKLQIEADNVRRQTAGETPTLIVSTTDVLRAVDAQTGVEYFIPISSLVSAPPDLSGYTTTTALNTALTDYVASNDFDNMVKLTQAAYDALGVKVARTLYVIVG